MRLSVILLIFILSQSFPLNVGFSEASESPAQVRVITFFMSLSNYPPSSAFIV